MALRRLQPLDWAHPDFLEDLLTMTNHMMSAKDSFIMYKLCSAVNLFVTLALFFICCLCSVMLLVICDARWRSRTPAPARPAVGGIVEKPHATPF